LSIEAVESVYDKDVDYCKKEHQEALKEYAQYKKELEELENIANPEARYVGKDLNDKIEGLNKVVEAQSGTNDAVEPKKEPEAGNDVIADSPAAAPGPSDEKGTSPVAGETPTVAPILMSTEIHAFSKDKCLAFVDYERRHSHRRQQRKGKQEPKAEPASPVDGERSCDTARLELQEAFTEAYKEVLDLLGVAKDRVAEVDDCMETAKAKKTGEMVPLVAQREKATGRMESSSGALAALEPVLRLLDDRVERLQEHIKTTLTPECKEAGEVSELLQKVRDLIMSLERCPGRDDFRLQIPEVVEEEPEDEEVEEEKRFENDNEFEKKFENEDEYEKKFGNDEEGPPNEADSAAMLAKKHYHHSKSHSKHSKGQPHHHRVHAHN